MGGALTYRIGLYTLGCKVSQYETEAIAEEFERRGFTVLDFEDECDVYVINTCTVTKESDRKSRQLIRRAIKRNPNALVAVCGCYAQTSAKEIAKIEGVSYISGTNGKLKIADALIPMLDNPPKSPVIAVEELSGAKFEQMSIAHAPRTRAYIKIEDGCECRCTYCAIPGARGDVRSKRPDDIINEINTLTENGTYEIVLTGIETASYGSDLDGFRLIDLLERIERETKVGRIRLGSLTPELLRTDFVERVARLKRITPHFHLSVQSGCDRTLAMMKRRYNTKMALDGIKRLREVMPSVMLTADVMVGFPDESDEDFMQTKEFLRRAKFLDMHIFSYSKRKNTPAADYPNQVPEDVKGARSRELMELRDEMSDSLLDGVVSEKRELCAVLETREGCALVGHSAEYIRVRVESDFDLCGQALTVIPVSRTGKILDCKIKG